MHSDAIAARFWNKVDRSAGPDACWPFNGARHGYGYGQFCIDSRLRRAHQVAWELHYGEPFPRPLLGRHLCHNPPCCNPLHIQPGTHQDNVNDAIERGTIVRKSQHRKEKIVGRYKLKADEANVITAIKAGESYRRIAGRYGVTCWAVKSFCARRGLASNAANAYALAAAQVPA